MRTRRTYVDLFMPGVFVLFAVTVWLFWQTAVRMEREQAMYVVTASLSSGEITGELLLEMTKIPGFDSYQAMYCQETELHIGKYRAPAQIQGVNLSEYSLTAVSSAGEKKLGTKPLLILGENFLKSLQDEGGRTITERQAQVLAETINDQEVYLTVAGRGTSGEARTAEADILGFVREDGVYMDAQQMRDYLTAQGLPCPVGRVQIYIKGQKNAANASESLQNAGFAAELIPAQVY